MLWVRNCSSFRPLISMLPLPLWRKLSLINLRNSRILPSYEPSLNLICTPSYISTMMSEFSNFGYKFRILHNFSDFSSFGYHFWRIPNLYHH